MHCNAADRSACPGTRLAYGCGFRPGLAGAVLIEYERHQPEKSLLHRVVREDLEPFLHRSRSAGVPVTRFVEREIRAYLECGVLAHGFLRVHCDACGHDRLVAFSCKGRGWQALSNESSLRVGILA